MTQPVAVIKKWGVLLEISLDGTAPLPSPVRETLEDALSYVHLDMHYGVRSFSPGGARHDATPIHQRLYEYDSRGRMVCMKGHQSKIHDLLQRAGYRVLVWDRNPPLSERVRPDCYEPNWDRVVGRFNFRPKQDLCLALIDAAECGIIDAPPAFGKMWEIAMVCCLYPHAKIDVITRRRPIAASIYRLLLEHIPDVGRVGGGHRHPDRVTVITAESLHHSSFDADIVLVDECHELTSDDKMSMLAHYEQARMFGFTASKATRMDNDWRRLDCLFGPTIFKMTQQEAERLGLVVPICVLWLKIEIDQNPVAGIDHDVALKRWGYWRNDARNSKIASVAKELYDQGKQVLLLVDTIDHALHLRKFLPDFTVAYAEGGLADEQDRHYYIQHQLLDPRESSMTRSRLEEIMAEIEKREVMGVISTSVLSTGVSFPSLQVVGRLNGDTSDTTSIQLPGRVCRTDANSGKEYGILIDCDDVFDPRLKQRSDKRRRLYGKQGWVQVLDDGSIWKPRQHA